MQHAHITGASRGLGRALALGFSAVYQRSGDEGADAGILCQLLNPIDASELSGLPALYKWPSRGRAYNRHVTGTPSIQVEGTTRQPPGGLDMGILPSDSYCHGRRHSYSRAWLLSS
jgi:NAD(P)-dependent dehydrogenase (short-subunit alcohol dehydrogenase family)